MRKEIDGLIHLVKNLERISQENSIFNINNKRKAFKSLDQENIYEWLDTFLPNTRIILEPQIIGSVICIQYFEGKLTKAINYNSDDITNNVIALDNFPKNISIKNKIEIQGVLYEDKNTSENSNKMEYIEIQSSKSSTKRLSFCAFKIFHCNINHFQSLQELKKLNFEIPQTQFTNFTSDIEIYLRCWKDGKLFQSYPTNGIVLKINSRKLQKYFQKNNVPISFLYTKINDFHLKL